MNVEGNLTPDHDQLVTDQEAVVWKTDRSFGGNASHRQGSIVSMSSKLRHMREPSNVWASCFSVSLAGITRREDRTKPLRLPNRIRIY